MRVGSASKLGIVAAGFWKRRRFGALLVFAVVWLQAAAAAAASITFSIEEFIGGDAEVTFTLEEIGDYDGNGTNDLLVTAEVTLGSDDLRGIFFDVADDSLLAGLSIEGVGANLKNSSPIINVGPGANLFGGGKPVYFDVGIEIGTAGKKDFFDSVTFVVMHDTLDLDLTLFSEQLFGARTTSKGRKLRGEAPTIVPEPGTAGLTILGLAMLAAAGRKRRRRPGAA